ncbi:Alpha/beta hydrolase fold-1 [Mycena belliarum]|uniref:Alpha/beta hydrolase fold-1 n=1 Tax=Mycena belliarum TaxID=1033014 RepID=A0AAD6XGX2_9AGAR|nr:Alpha/beta hydrolase fold-1 [Mycena belliae]
MFLHTTSVVFESRSNTGEQSGTGLKMTAKRYHTAESRSNADGFSLLFAHCIGSHKEQWEPIIEQVFRVQHAKGKTRRVHEAWAFDWQNHGDAAVLNRAALAESWQMGVTADVWADAIAAFVRSPRMLGKRMVAIGHSAGAAAMINSLQDIQLRAPPYACIVLLEPTIATPELFYQHMAPSVPANVAATLSRRARWPSREAAYEWLRWRTPWRTWDPRVLRLFTLHGLEATSDGGVALKCDVRQEARAFPDVAPHFAAAEALARVARAVPVHLVWATRSHLMPRALQDALAARGAASITRVESGHMIVQEQPERAAVAICAALDGVGIDLGGRARSRM